MYNEYSWLFPLAELLHDSSTAIKYENRAIEKSHTQTHLYTYEQLYWKIPLNPLPLRNEKRELAGSLLESFRPKEAAAPLFWLIIPGERNLRDRSVQQDSNQVLRSYVRTRK